MFIMQAVADDPDGSIVQEVIYSLVNMERAKPKSSDFLVRKLLQRLARFAFYHHSAYKPVNGGPV